MPPDLLKMDAWRNGDWVTSESLSVSIRDTGFVQGVTVSEQLRTFQGRPFRVDDHLSRLWQSLESVGVNPGVDPPTLNDVIQQVADRNHPHVAPGGDLRIVLWVTPGTDPRHRPAEPAQPVVCCYAEPLHFREWGAKYKTGERLVTSRFRQISPDNWPPALKCRSRMHYYLADKEAREIDPAARGLLLDLDGFVCEASTANVVAYFSERGLVSPRRERILPGISLLTVQELAGELAVPFGYSHITPGELEVADEIWLASTPFCVLPVTWLDGCQVGDGTHPRLDEFLGSWSERVDVDIVSQAQSCA